VHEFCYLADMMSMWMDMLMLLDSQWLVQASVKGLLFHCQRCFLVAEREGWCCTCTELYATWAV